MKKMRWGNLYLNDKKDMLIRFDAICVKNKKTKYGYNLIVDNLESYISKALRKIEDDSESKCAEGN